MESAQRHYGGITARFTLWTDAVRDRLADLYLADPKPVMAAIAEAMGRSVQSVTTEINRQGLAEPGVARRLCLPGQHMFWSAHIGNRICRRCTVNVVLECA